MFTAATQLSPGQEVMLLGSERSFDLDIPLNSDPTRPASVFIDDGSKLAGKERNAEVFGPVNQYRLQAETFGKAVRGEAPLPFPIEDAVANMNVIDALFRSAGSASWEVV